MLIGGAAAPVAPTCADAGPFWRAGCRQHGLVFIGGILLERGASWRGRGAKPVSL
jgi:hypothetical protein